MCWRIHCLYHCSVTGVCLHLHCLLHCCAARMFLHLHCLLHCMLCNKNVFTSSLFAPRHAVQQECVYIFIVCSTAVQQDCVYILIVCSTAVQHDCVHTLHIFRACSTLRDDFSCVTIKVLQNSRRFLSAVFFCCCEDQ